MSNHMIAFQTINDHRVQCEHNYIPGLRKLSRLQVRTGKVSPAQSDRVFKKIVKQTNNNQPKEI